MSLADSVRAHRLARGWSQELLAQQAQVSLGTVRMIETSRTPNPQISTVVALAKALEVPLLDLLGDEHGH